MWTSARRSGGDEAAPSQLPCSSECPIPLAVSPHALCEFVLSDGPGQWLGKAAAQADRSHAVHALTATLPASVALHDSP